MIQRLLRLMLLAGLLAACANTPTPPPSGTLLVSEPFIEHTALWIGYSNGHNAAQIENGVLNITVGEPSQVVISLANFALITYDMRVTVQQVAGPPENGFGVIFGYTSPTEFYRFDVAGDGRWGLSHYSGGEWQFLAPLQESDAVNAGLAANQLRLLVEADRITLFSNGQRLLQYPYTATQSSLGLFASSFSEGGVQVQFDDLEIHALR